MGQIEEWFESNQRDFPWRSLRTPYRVWISEVMLQQTRASVVVPYFLRWMDLFPDVKTLYKAPLEQVIKAWEGLGYYSRARNLHRAAQQIVEEFGGEIPNTRKELLSIRGFGPYTTNALLSFAFQKKALPVDGNVLRVLSRYFFIEENISKPSVRQKIEKMGEPLLDIERPWVTAEALIELGATVCLPKPKCEACPLNHRCFAFQKGQAENLPIKTEARESTLLKRKVFVIFFEEFVLVRKGEAGKVMADLYEFPYFEESEEGARFSAEAFYQEELKWIFPLKERVHTFTRYKVHLFPHLFKSSLQKNPVGFEWVHLSQLSQIPFSAGHRKIADEVAFLPLNMISL